MLGLRQNGGIIQSVPRDGTEGYDSERFQRSLDRTMAAYLPPPAEVGDHCRLANTHLVLPWATRLHARPGDSRAAVKPVPIP